MREGITPNVGEPGEGISPALLTRLLFEQSPTALVVYDASLRVIACNEAMSRLVGVPARQVIGVHIDDLRDQRHRRALARALAGESLVYETPYQATGSERWFWASVTFSPLRDDEGRVVAVLLSVIDRTAQREAEGTAPATDTQLSEAQRLGRVGSWTWDIERNTAAASPEFYRILGVAAPSQVTLTVDFERFIHVDDRAFVRERVSQSLADQSPFEACEFRIVRADGLERAVVMRAEVRYVGTRPVSAWGTLQDVSERRQLEEQVRRAQRMEALGQLAGGVAHDFNNLLTVIRVDADFLMVGLRKEDPLQEEVGEILQASNRAARLTHQLLAFSRKQLLRPRVLDLNQLVTETSAMLRRVIGEDVELVTDLQPAMPRLFADPGQLEQVLVNLAINARDAMPDGGVLRIETRTTVAPLRESERAPGDWVVVTVSDTGHGMDPSVRHRIFDPFFTTKAVGKGTGLGLSTVLGIVEQSGGVISVESTPGHGTRFTIQLPCADVEHETIEVDGARGRLTRERGCRRATVLLVEDEVALRGVAQRTLERDGYTVLSGEDGYEALAIAESFSSRIDLLVTDMVLPGIDGREVARRLLRARPNTRVLYMTGYTDDEIFRRGLADDEMLVLEKPFSAEQLADAVQSALLGADCAGGAP